MSPDARSIGILILEDNPAVATLASHLLRRAGYHVRVAISAEQATRVLHAHDRIDILVCDLEFEHLKGREVASRIQGERPDLAVMFICGTDCASVHHKLNEEEHDSCPGAPFTPSHLLRGVTLALANIPRS